LYLKDARLALELLPNEFSYKEFLEFLFLTVEHYNQFWYNRLEKAKWFFEESLQIAEERREVKGKKGQSRCN